MGRSNIIRHLTALVLVPAVLLATSGGASAACTASVFARLKVVMSGATPLVSARINGREISLVAESGSTYSFLSPRTVAEFKLGAQPGNPYMHSQSLGGEESISITTVKTLNIQDHALSNVKFLVSNSEMWRDSAGALGENILGVADADYDLASGSITLIREAGCGVQPFVVWDASKRFSMIPMEFNSDQFKRVIGEAFVNGRRMRVLFDSGTDASILSLEAAKRAGIKPGDPGATPADPLHGVGRRMVPSWTAPVASFKIGKEEVKNTRLRIASLAPLEVDIILGADFFLSHRIYMANSQQRIYFTWNGGRVFEMAATPRGDTRGPAEVKAEPQEPRRVDR